ncbi:MAG: oligosaccharide flippase family protein [Thermoanaerobaculia bacterium]
MAASLTLYGILVLCAHPMAKLLGLPLLAPLVPVGINAILFGLLTIPVAPVRQRAAVQECGIRAHGRRDRGRSDGSRLASAGYGYRTLVVENILVVAGQTIGMWGAARWWPRLAFRTGALKDALAYSGPLILNSLVGYCTRTGRAHHRFAGVSRNRGSQPRLLQLSTARSVLASVQGQR